MDLDSAITLVLVALMFIGPVLTAVLIVLNVKQKKQINDLNAQINEMAGHVDERLRQNENALRDELAKQRRMLTESLADINENVTRGVVSMSKGKKQ